MGTITQLPVTSSLDLDDVARIAGTLLFDSRPDYLRLHQPDVIPTEWLEYGRKSVVRNEKQAVGLDRQHRSCEAKIAGQGRIVRSFVDEDRSASKYSRKARPKFEELVRLVASGSERGRGIVFYNQDRFVRRPDEYEQILVACELGGVNYLWAADGETDLRNSMQVTFARIRAAINAQEAADVSRRVKIMHEDYGDEGLWSGGIPPFGYRPVPGTIRDQHGNTRSVTRLEVVPEEEAIILEVVARVLAGDTLAAICRDLDERGIPTRRGGKWHRMTLKGMLTGYPIAGRRVHSPRSVDGKIIGTRVVVAEWPAIVDETTHRRLVALLDDSTRDRRAGKGNRARHLLSGLVVCGICGGRMTHAHGQVDYRSGTPKRRKPAYACKQKGCTRIVAAYLEEQVVAETFASLDRRRQATKRGQRGKVVNVTELRAQLELVRERRAKAYADHTAPELGQRATTADEWQAARDRLDAQEAAIEAKLAPVELDVELDAAGYDLESRWDTLDDDEKRRELRRLVKTVTVKRATSSGGRGHDASRVDVEFYV